MVGPLLSLRCPKRNSCSLAVFGRMAHPGAWLQLDVRIARVKDFLANGFHLVLLLHLQAHKHSEQVKVINTTSPRSKAINGVDGSVATLPIFFAKPDKPSLRTESQKIIQFYLFKILIFHNKLYINKVGSMLEVRRNKYKFEIFLKF